MTAWVQRSGCDYSLQLGAILCDGLVALGKIAEFGLELECVTPLIVIEDILYSHPNRESRGAGLHDDIKNLHGDRTTEPRKNSEVVAVLIDVISSRNGIVDMRCEGVCSKGNEKEVPPLGIVGGLKIKGDPHVFWCSPHARPGQRGRERLEGSVCP